MISGKLYQLIFFSYARKNKNINNLQFSNALETYKKIIAAYAYYGLGHIIDDNGEKRISKIYGKRLLSWLISKRLILIINSKVNLSIKKIDLYNHFL